MVVPKQLDSDVSCVGSRFPQLAEVVHALHAVRQPALLFCCQTSSPLALQAWRGPKDSKAKLGTQLGPSVSLQAGKLQAKQHKSHFLKTGICWLMEGFDFFSEHPGSG